MSRLPRLTGHEVVQALSRAGFGVVRQRGSHLFLRHADGRATVVPTHGNEVLGPGIMSKILRDTKLSREEFRKLLE
jgi:predicted RNA binding protein YcfA (HicA-like mRNA interferase family)